MLDVIKSRGLPLDRITTTDVWATDTIPANLPEMMEFKAKMDQIIWSMYHIEVEHLCALNKDGSKKTYEQMFYHVPVRRSQSGQVERERERERAGLRAGSILGFPDLWNPWCQAGLKRNAYAQSPGKHHRISSEHPVQLVSKTQTCARFHSGIPPFSGDHGAGGISRFMFRHQGFPAQISPWCRKLKIDKVRTPFQMSAPRGAKTEISWNTWASQRTSQNGLGS